MSDTQTPMSSKDFQVTFLTFIIPIGIVVLVLAGMWYDYHTAIAKQAIEAGMVQEIQNGLTIWTKAK